MIVICHPHDEIELALLQCALEAEEIPCFVFGYHVGSLLPGVQIPSYNERRLAVPESCVVRANEIVRDLRATDVQTTFTVRSKLRMVLELFLFGWFFPEGTSKPVNRKSEE